MNDELSFERRRYGTTTYTWVSVKLGEDWVSLGDPWPCITPKKVEVAREVERVKKERAAKPTRRYFEEGAEIGTQIIEESGWYVQIGGAWYWDEESQEIEVKP